jgi:hypothetical protein
VIESEGDKFYLQPIAMQPIRQPPNLPPGVLPEPTADISPAVARFSDAKKPACFVLLSTPPTSCYSAPPGAVGAAGEANASAAKKMSHFFAVKDLDWWERRCLGCLSPNTSMETP